MAMHSKRYSECDTDIRKWPDVSILLFLTLNIFMGSNAIAWPFTHKPAPQEAKNQSHLITQPAWYGQLSISDGLLIGYGHAESRDEAIGLARKDIASQIQSHITTEDRIETRKTGVSVEQSYSASSVSRSDVILEETEIFKDELVQSGWYVAVVFDYSPLHYRLSRKSGLSLCMSDYLKIDQYTRHTELFKRLSGEAKCIPRFKLSRDNGKWYISAGKVLIGMKNSDDFAHYWFVSHQSDQLNLEVEPRQISHGGNFKLRITSTKNGYISLFNVYGSGIVSELASNIPVDSSKPLIFPDAYFSGQELIGVLENPHKAAQEMYVAVFTEQIRPNDGFYLTTSSIQHRNNGAMMDKLIESLNNTVFSSAILQIEPR